MKPLYFLIVLGVFLFTSCKTEQKFEKEKIARLYVDILIADETYKHDKDSLKFVTDSLFNYYKIHSEDYKSELEKFKFDETAWDEFFLSVETYLDTLNAIEDRRVAILDSNKSVLKDSAKIHSILSGKN